MWKTMPNNKIRGRLSFFHLTVLANFTLLQVIFFLKIFEQMEIKDYLDFVHKITGTWSVPKSEREREINIHTHTQTHFVP